MDLKDFEKRFQEFIQNKKIKNLEELNQELERFIYIENRRPLSDFCGLSPYKMFRYLYFPFNSPDNVVFNTNAKPPLDAHFIKLFILLIKGINDAGSLKATGTGNLPRDFCRELEKLYLSEEEAKFLLRDKFPIMKETDFQDLHRIRIVANKTGYIRIYKKKYILTKRAKKIITDGFTIHDYLQLLKIYTLNFNWAYNDFYWQIDIIQDSFLFTLYLLKIFGNEFKPPEFYAEKFFIAFPDVLKRTIDELRSINDPEDIIKRTYIRRALDLFAINWGFAEIKDKSQFWLSENEIKKTSFLDEFIEFR